MSRTKAWGLSNKSKGAAYESGKGYKGVLRRGSKYGWKYEDGKTSQNRGGFDTAEEAAYDYDEFLIHYVGPDADTNQALGLLKMKTVLAIREKISKRDKPVNKADKRHDKIGISGYRGVSKNASKKKPFKAQTYVNGKYVAIGTFETAIEAARAFDAFILRHQGHHAITNIKLGLLPPVGEPDKPVIELQGPPKPPKEKKKPVIEPEFKPCLTAEEERLAQIEAARNMCDDEDENEEGGELAQALPDPLPSESNSTNSVEKVVTSFMGEVIPPASIPQSTELIVMSDADKLRQQANALLRQAAEAEAGDIKRQAAARIDTLSATTAKIQSVMMSLIDCCADIETELKELKKLLSK